MSTGVNGITTVDGTEAFTYVNVTTPNMSISHLPDKAVEQSDQNITVYLKFSPPTAIKQIKTL